MQSETVAAEYSVSGFCGPDRPPQMADGFTKGCVGVQPRGKERLDNLEKKDRERHLLEIRNPTTKRGKTGEKSPCGTFALTVRQKSRQEALDTMDSFRDGLSYYKPFGLSDESNNTKCGMRPTPAGCDRRGNRRAFPHDCGRGAFSCDALDF